MMKLIFEKFKVLKFMIAPPLCEYMKLADVPIYGGGVTDAVTKKEKTQKCEK